MKCHEVSKGFIYLLVYEEVKKKLQTLYKPDW